MEESQVNPKDTSSFVNQLFGLGTPTRSELKSKRAKRKVAKSRRDEVFTVSKKQLLALVDAAKDEALGPERHATLRAICLGLLEVVPKRHRNNEKSSNVLPPQEPESKADEPENAGPPPSTPPVESEKPKAKRPNHRGRLQSADYPFAEHTSVLLDGLAAGQNCPCGCGGKLKQEEDSIVLRFVGQAPVKAHSYDCQRLRCSKCQERFTAKLPVEAGKDRQQPSAIAVIGLLKYGSGFPFNRMANMLGLSGVALAATTQFEMVWAGAKKIWPAYAELIKQGAQGSTILSDDTSMKILEGDRPDEFGERTGVFTSGIQSHLEGGAKVAIFVTGVRHSGENMTILLRQRREDLEPPMHMSDGLKHNAPKPGSPKVIQVDCLVHGRRYFVDIFDAFPGHCRYVLNSLGQVYANDATTKERKLTPAERLAFHQQESQGIMDDLRIKMQADLSECRVEENSQLGKAYRYILKRWEGLTVFLRVAGAPLDNNLLEQQLKKAVLHRKNSLYYRSDRGAAVGDIYMSLIKTCELNGANPLDYLTQLQVHAVELAANPSAWMPWSYLNTLNGLVEQSRTQVLPRAA